MISRQSKNMLNSREQGWKLKNVLLHKVFQQRLILTFANEPFGKDGYTWTYIKEIPNEICWLQPHLINPRMSFILWQEKSFILALLQMKVNLFLQNFYAELHFLFLITRICHESLLYPTMKRDNNLKWE